MVIFMMIFYGDFHGDFHDSFHDNFHDELGETATVFMLITMKIMVIKILPCKTPPNIISPVGGSPLQDYCDGGVHRERGPKVRNYDDLHGLDLDLDDTVIRWKMLIFQGRHHQRVMGGQRRKYPTLAFSPHLQYVWQLWQI